MLDWLTLDGDRGEKLDCTMVGERGEMLDWLTAGGDRGERLCCLTTAGELAHPSKSSSDSVSVTAWKELARFVRDHSDIEELSTVLNQAAFWRNEHIAVICTIDVGITGTIGKR